MPVTKLRVSRPMAAPASPASSNLRIVLSELDLPRARLVRAVLLGALGVGCAVALMGVSAWLIARASQMPPVLDLTMAVVAVRAFGIGRAMFRYLERLASHNVALAGLVRLRTRLYSALATGDPRIALGLRRGDLLARIGADVDQIGDVVIKGLLPFGVAGVVTAVAIAGTVLVLPAAGGTLLLAVLIAGVLAPWLAARTAARAHADSVDARARISVGTLAHLDSLPELKVAGMVDSSRRRLDAWEDEWAGAIDRTAGPSAVAAALQHVALAVGVLGGLLLGAPAVADGRIGAVLEGGPGRVARATIEACSGLPDAAAELVAGERAAGRLAPLLTAADAARPAHESSTPGTGTGLQAEGLRVGWDQPLPAVPTHVSVQPGRLTAVVGPSGAGKTTLALTLAGLIRPLTGSVTIDGRPLAGVDDLPRTVNFTAHDAHVFGTTLRENLLVAAAEGTTDATLLAAAERAGMKPWLDGLPDGLDTRLSPGGENLSGGERRRLLLTRALLTGARVLILDEPTEHLDTDSAASVFSELADLAHGAPGRPGPAVVVLTHDEAVAADSTIRIAGHTSRSS